MIHKTHPRTRRFRGVSLLVLAALALALSSPGAAPAQPNDERVQQLEAAVEELRAELESLRSGNPPAGTVEERIAELERRIEILAAELEALRLGAAASAKADAVDRGYGPAASKVYRSGAGLSIGGYGEIVFEAEAGSFDDGTPSGGEEELELRRAVFYFGYKFGDDWLLNSEVELEEGGEEVSVEFLYVDKLWKPGLNFRFGHVLVPMGLVNELHEPTVFLGVNRPAVERVLLPSTWHETGAGLFGDVGAVSYRTYLLVGFDAAGFTAGGLRGGRQGAEAEAEGLAWVGRLDYVPVNGLTLGASAYFGGDAGEPGAEGGEDPSVNVRITELHADWRWKGLQLRGLYAWAELDDVAALNRSLGLAGAESVGDQLAGGYVEAGYDLLSHGSARGQLTPFVRWETIDTQAGVPAGFLADPANDQEILTLGIDYKPIPQLVFKLDYQDRDDGAGTGLDQLSLGVGYVF